MVRCFQWCQQTKSVMKDSFVPQRTDVRIFQWKFPYFYNTDKRQLFSVLLSCMSSVYRWGANITHDTKISLGQTSSRSFQCNIWQNSKQPNTIFHKMSNNFHTVIRHLVIMWSTPTKFLLLLQCQTNSTPQLIIS